MKYDIATKVIMDRAGSKLLEFFLGFQLESLEFIEELPQESVSLKRSDYIMKITKKRGNEFAVVWEFLSNWKEKSIINLMMYTLRVKLKHGLSVTPVVFLLKKSNKATNRYRDENFYFTFRLIKVYNLNALRFLKKGVIQLFPFIPLMKGADEKVVFETEQKIYQSNLAREDKADLLTALTFFAGLKDKGLAQKLLDRRRDIMIESYAYNIIKEEGKVEGREEGREEGEFERLREDIMRVLSVRFNYIPSEVIGKIEETESLSFLDGLLTKAISVENLDAFKTVLKMNH